MLRKIVLESLFVLAFLIFAVALFVSSTMVFSTTMEDAQTITTRGKNAAPPRQDDTGTRQSTAPMSNRRNHIQ